MSSTAQDRSSMDLDEAIQSLPPELREKIYKDFVSRIMRERKEKGWKEVHKGVLVETKIREKKRMGWNGVHYEIEGAPFFDCDEFYYTDEYLSNFEREEIHEVDPAVLAWLVNQTFHEGWQNPMEVDGKKRSLQEELDEIDPEELREIMVCYMWLKPEEVEQAEEDFKKQSPEIAAEITRNLANL